MQKGRSLKIVVYAIISVMLLPILITVPVAMTTTGYMTFPPVGLTIKWFFLAFQDEILVESLVRSLKLAICASLLSIAVGLPATFCIERTQFKGKSLVEIMFSGPQMIPLIIYVLGLLIFYETINLSETFLGLLISHVLICLPFSFRTLLVSVSSLDKRLEWSAEILGANRVQTFTRVILPQIKTGMIAAFIFTFILSFNNVTLALFLSGVGKRTLPVEMFQRLYVGGITPTIPAISFILSVFGVILFIIADRTVGVYKFLGGGGK